MLVNVQCITVYVNDCYWNVKVCYIFNEKQLLCASNIPEFFVILVNVFSINKLFLPMMTNKWFLLNYSGFKTDDMKSEDLDKIRTFKQR